MVGTPALGAAAFHAVLNASGLAATSPGGSSTPDVEVVGSLVVVGFVVVVVGFDVVGMVVGMVDGTTGAVVGTVVAAMVVVGAVVVSGVVVGTVVVVVGSPASCEAIASRINVELPSVLFVLAPAEVDEPASDAVVEEEESSPTVRAMTTTTPSSTATTTTGMATFTQVAASP
jgi:hypothetical protein